MHILRASVSFRLDSTGKKRFTTQTIRPLTCKGMFNMSKRSEQRKASLAYRNKKLAVSRQTTKQAAQVKSGTEYSKRKFDLLKQINYVLSNPKDRVTGEPIFKEEYRLQARRHKAALINKETALNGDRQLQIGNDIRSWNEKAAKAAFGRQKTKGKSKIPTGWI